MEAVVPQRQSRPVVLIAEDEYVIAAELASWIENSCLSPLGPVASVQAGRDLLDKVDRPAAAILDIQLRGEKVFPLAQMLQTRGVPFIFMTGYDRCILPAEFSDLPLVSKPTSERQVLSVLHQVMQRSGQSGASA
jgi:CheY-like chemotaxis protein